MIPFHCILFFFLLFKFYLILFSILFFSLLSSSLMSSFHSIPSYSMISRAFLHPDQHRIPVPQSWVNTQWNKSPPAPWGPIWSSSAPWPYLTLPHSQGSPALMFLTGLPLLPPSPDPVFLLLFAFLFPQQMGTGRDVQNCIHGGVQQGLE